MPAVGRPVDGRVAVLVWGGGGAVAVEQDLHQVVVTTGCSEVDSCAAHVVPGGGREEGREKGGGREGGRGREGREGEGGRGREGGRKGEGGREGRRGKGGREDHH